ncbi:MAG: guanine deaminase [Candidatus Dojkabacteria bacterium]|nr:guanine deaminase [Candidatus Dojkabacteria bacterium]
MATVYKALIFTPTSDRSLKVYNPGFLAVSDNGKIEEISEENLQEKYENYEFIDLSDYLIIPGLIDIHNYLPQYAFAGIGDKELLPWLENYTFPREKTFEHDETARKSAQKFFTDLLKNGTTTTVTYVTIHKNATEIAFEEAERAGIRAVIGKVNMDQNSPDFLIENKEVSLQESRQLAEKWHRKNNRLFYVVTPRFAVSCTMDMMKELARLAKNGNYFIQSHLSESKGEIDFVKKLFPECKSYTEVYEKAGLLGKKTIMAHCVHCSREEIEILKKTETKIAHCPTSNRFLKSGILPLRNYLDEDLVIGLGTDVAGGYSLSMINEMKEAIENSKYYQLFTDESAEPVSPSEAFYLATLGGAQALGFEHEIGSLEKGKKADFVVVDHKATDPENGEGEYGKPEQILSRLIYRGGGQSIKDVFIQGVRVSL